MFFCLFFAHLSGFPPDMYILSSEDKYNGDIFIERKSPASSCQFSDCLFNTISSQLDGGAIYFNIVGRIAMQMCRFDKVTTTMKYGAFYIGIKCTEAIINRTCINDCSATETHGFKIDCLGSQVTNLVVTFCARSTVGSYGSIWFNAKPLLVTDVNSTFNRINAHGAGIWFDNCKEFVSSRLHIESCVSMGVMMMRYSLNMQVHYMNFVRNTNSRDALLYVTEAVTLSDCTFFYNTNGLSNKISVLTFSDCVFSIAQASGAKYIGNNIFSTSEYTMKNVFVPNSAMCLLIPSNSKRNVSQFSSTTHLLILVFLFTIT